MPNLNNLTTQDKQWGAELWSSKGYIDGLTMQWVSGTALTVTAGTAYIESEQRLIPVTSAIAKTGLSLSASTWYHVYLYLNAGVPDIEIVTTAPAAPYHGTARSKTGDTSRRYVGSVKTEDASGNLINFLVNGNRVTYVETIGTGSRTVLGAGAATTETNVSLAGVVPITSRLADIRLQDTDGVATWEVMLPGGVIQNAGNADQVYVFPVITDTSGNIAYKLGGAPTGGNGLYIAVGSYTYER